MFNNYIFATDIMSDPDNHRSLVYNIDSMWSYRVRKVPKIKTDLPILNTDRTSWLTIESGGTKRTHGVTHERREWTTGVFSISYGLRNRWVLTRFADERPRDIRHHDSRGIRVGTRERLRSQRPGSRTRRVNISRCTSGGCVTSNWNGPLAVGP